MSQAKPLTVYVGGGDDSPQTGKSGVAQVISASGKVVKMGKRAKLWAKLKKGTGKLSYKSSNPKVVKVGKRGVLVPVRVGKATVTITASRSGKFAKTTKKVKVTVKRGSQALVFKKQAKVVKAAKLKKAKQAVSIAKAKGAKASVRYSIVKVSKAKFQKRFSIGKKTGKITVKKGTPQGVYKVTVKAKSAKNKNWNAAGKNAVITIKVK